MRLLEGSPGCKQPHQLQRGGAAHEVLVRSGCQHSAAGAAAEAQEGGRRQVARQPRSASCISDLPAQAKAKRRWS
jgi:hypothetical protein